MKQCKFCTTTEDKLNGGILLKGILDTYICTTCVSNMIPYITGYFTGALKASREVIKEATESTREANKQLTEINKTLKQ